MPLPDAAAIAHSARLVDVITARIETREGVIGFDEYMQLALYEPGLGYYSAAATKIGASGDFVTAPEISPLFGFCLARQATAVIEQGCSARGFCLARQVAAVIEQGCSARILEFGAGGGKLCAQILSRLPTLERYQILDLSADLKQRQQNYLRAELSAELFHKIE
jgi:SAM-dependent MidA family methyltransferase